MKAVPRLDEILRSHLIEPATLQRDDFEGFFRIRTEAMLDLITKAMGKSLSIELLADSAPEYPNAKSNGFSFNREIVVNH